MDWQIRIALIIVGIIVIGFIYYDYNRRKKTQAEQQRLIDSMRATSEQVDAAGFDFTGVGPARKSGDKLTSEKTADNSKIKAQSDISDNVQLRTEPQFKPVKRTTPTEQMSLNVEDERLKNSSALPELVFSLILKANEASAFKGKDFMPLFLSQGLRHGEMGIFHRHSTGVGKPGPVMYSLANALKPGTFDLKNIEHFETPAFAFFMTVPGPLDPMVAYEGMVKTIQMLQQQLGGQILDDTKSVYTEQTHQHQVEVLHNYLMKISLKK